MNNTTCFHSLDDVLENCDDLNALEDLTPKVETLSSYDTKKLSAFIEETKPSNITEVMDIFEMLDDFELLEDVHTDFDLGYYLICEWKYLGEIPTELKLFIDYEKYGNFIRCKGLAAHTSYGCLFNYSLSHQ